MKLGLIMLGGFVGAYACACASAPCPSEAEAGRGRPPFVVTVRDAGGQDADAEPFDTPNGYTRPICADACTNLKARCPAEYRARAGEDSCYIVCKRVEETGKIDQHLGCAAKARTPEEVRACGQRCGVSDAGAR